MHARRWRLSPASFRALQPSTAKRSVNGRRVGRHPGERLMLPLRGGVREVEEWFIQAFSRINSTSLSSSPSPLSPVLALTLALTIDFTLALTPPSPFTLNLPM